MTINPDDLDAMRADDEFGHTITRPPSDRSESMPAGLDPGASRFYGRPIQRDGQWLVPAGQLTRLLGT